MSKDIKIICGNSMDLSSTSIGNSSNRYTEDIRGTVGGKMEILEGGFKQNNILLFCQSRKEEANEVD